MSEPPRKTDMVIDCMRQGDWRGALKIANRFRLGLTPDQKASLRRAHEVSDITKARSYQQMGFKISETFDQGVAVLQELYGSRL